MLFGARAFRETLQEKLVLAEMFCEALGQRIAQGVPIEIVDPPQLSCVPFRLARRPLEPLAAWNARNASWLAAINARGRVYLSSTLLPTQDGAAVTLRVCILGFRTHEDRVRACLTELEDTL
jgi:hypothetical protein